MSENISYYAFSCLFERKATTDDQHKGSPFDPSSGHDHDYLLFYQISINRDES